MQEKEDLIQERRKSKFLGISLTRVKCARVSALRLGTKNSELVAGPKF